MTAVKILALLKTIHSDLNMVKELVYDQCGFELSKVKQNIESKEYGACTFDLNGKTILQRVSRITPTKSGQFVSIWKRTLNGITEPFDDSDNFDFIIITTRKDNNFGQFIFPKSVLAEKGIITLNGKVGKRGIRVYPPWDIPTNKQAQKTQNWQTKYFLTIYTDRATDLDLAKELLSQSYKNA